MALAPGSRLGPDEVISAPGAGGVSADPAFRAPGRNEVSVQRPRDPSTRRQISPAGGVDLNLSGAARPPAFRACSSPSKGGWPTNQVTPDGQRFLLAVEPPREAGTLSSVLNWALLR